ncbi:L,D-transpeptidase family protein [Streptomyces abyssomicinicus]|uniref:L,D-transpeptidase family protein n=1 Tax=Streptomyces abyssomicinicus TaxID=574929 RepID=UPI00124FCE4D|nr:L,D-transpeptidase family protein [Streptomyces abyssomicinicus]
MRLRAFALACCLPLLCAWTAPGAPPPDETLPGRMADTGGGSQLITAEAASTASTTGTVTWWERTGGGRWERAGSAPARFGANGLTDGATRRQGTATTPTGLFGLPFAFGVEPAPAGARYPYRRVGPDAWWCQDNGSRAYNRWSEPLAADCRPGEAEHLIGYPRQYAHALVVGFNYREPVRERGAGVFLHVDGSGATAGCVSVPADAMRRVLRWADPARAPHIAIGTAGGPTAITRY